MFNQITLIGNVGSIKATDLGDDKIKTELSIATSESYWSKRDQERKTTTTWHRCINWNPGNTKYLGYVKKGNMLLVVGKQINRSYEKDGETKYISEVTVDTIKILKSKKNTESDDESEAPRDTTDVYDDEIPF